MFVLLAFASRGGKLGFVFVTTARAGIGCTAARS
jgi:hypothetical protein